MNTDIGYSFSEDQIQHVLPHRPPMLLVDRVASCAADLSALEAQKLISLADPMLYFTPEGRAYFPPTLLIEALAQTCGFLMNLHWLAQQGLDLARFSDGDTAEVAKTPIPHSVLAESRAKHVRLARPGELLALNAKLSLKHGDMFHFSASAGGGGGDCTRLEILLAFPDYTRQAA